MPRRLLMLNAALVAVAVVCALYVARQLLTPMPLPLPARASASGESTAATAATGGQPGEYSVVASRNLFSPTRSDTQTALTTDGGPAVPMVRPILHGVVLREDAPIAYLEDPSIKRVAGYRIGDSIVGGTVQTIAADHVVIRRPEGPVDVRLRDPSKPRPPAPPPVAGTPPPGGAAPVAGATEPTVAPPATLQPAPPAVAPSPVQPGRRPFPLLRRVPPGVQGDAAQN